VWSLFILSPTAVIALSSSVSGPVRPSFFSGNDRTGALDGSAEMNIWLHKQVMTKLAESGGKVPDSLKA
jgi:hypothetical protein